MKTYTDCVIKEGWGYQLVNEGDFARFRRAESDLPVRTAPEEHAMPGFTIAYTERGDRVQVRRNALGDSPETIRRRQESARRFGGPGG